MQHCISLTEAYQLFELECRARRLTPASMDFYRWRLQPFLAFCAEQGAALLTDVDANLIRRYFIELTDRGLADHSVHAAARAIRRFFNFCVTEDAICSHFVATPMIELWSTQWASHPKANLRRLHHAR